MNVDVKIAEGLRSSRSSERKSSAAKIRKLPSPDYGPFLLDAFKREINDKRTWEVQYNLVMALGTCEYTHAQDDLLKYAVPVDISMVDVGIGDAVFRLSCILGNQLNIIKLFLDTNNSFRKAGLLQSMAMMKYCPSEDEELILSNYVIENHMFRDWVDIWMIRSLPGFSESFSEHMICYMEGRYGVNNLQISAALELAKLRKYHTWSVL